MNLEKNWELYVSIIHTFDANFELARIYATSEKDLRNQFAPIIDEDVRMDYVGEGYYDLFKDWNGHWIVKRIDKILEEWIEYDLLEALIDPATAKRKFKESFSEFVYVVFQKEIVDFPTKYITFALVESDEKMSDYDVYKVLEKRGHKPAIIEGSTGLWANHAVLEVNDMEPEILFQFLKEYEERSEFIEYVYEDARDCQ